MKSEVLERASFDIVRYAQCWEDADVLLEALEIKPNDTVLSICSAGDNSFSLLSRGAKKVYAVDLSFCQVACAKLRRAAYKNLDYDEFIMFLNVFNDDSHEWERLKIFNSIKKDLDDDVILFFETDLKVIAKGFIHFGKFENYFKAFKEKVLPLIHSKKAVDELLADKTFDERVLFYDNKWNNQRWKILFKIFFSRYTMGRLGRDKEFFKYIDGSVADRILTRAKYALTALETSTNPYLHYILKGRYTDEKTLPHALRRENYADIQNNLGKIEFQCVSVEDFFSRNDVKINAFNMSDIFEYMSDASMETLYEILINNSNEGARIAYWNMLAPRQCPERLKTQYGVKTDEARNRVLLEKDKAFFYSRFFIDRF